MNPCRPYHGEVKWLSRTVVALVLLGGLFMAANVPLPYYAEGPGPAREVVPLIDLGGTRTYQPAGKLVMTTVRFEQLTPAYAVRAWLDPALSVVHRDVVYQPGLDVAEERERSLSEMDQSKIDAAYVVLSMLTDYPRERGRGALIEAAQVTCPAGGKLFAGDVILAIDGEPIGSSREASRVIGGTPAGEPLEFRVRAADETHDIEVTKRRCTDDAGTPVGDPLVGVALVNQFPIDVAISSGDVGGPSAGLMFALGMYDLMTPGELTAGDTVAGTGTIDLEGNVGPIGGIRDKVVAAQRAGATVFLVPAANMGELDGLDLDGIQLIEVATFADAVADLEERASAAA